MKECKYKKGDKVRVTKYGHPFWSRDKMPLKLIEKSNDVYWYDLSPEIVGQEGIIEKAHLTQGVPQYSIKGPDKYAWYNEEQIELLSTSKD